VDFPLAWHPQASAEPAILSTRRQQTLQPKNPTSPFFRQSSPQKREADAALRQSPCATDGGASRGGGPWWCPKTGRGTAGCGPSPASAPKGLPRCLLPELAPPRTPECLAMQGRPDAPRALEWPGDEEVGVVVGEFIFPHVKCTLHADCAYDASSSNDKRSDVEKDCALPPSFRAASRHFQCKRF
jgi:hypothetical protein